MLSVLPRLSEDYYLFSFSNVVSCDISQLASLALARTVYFYNEYSWDSTCSNMRLRAISVPLGGAEIKIAAEALATAISGCTGKPARLICRRASRARR